jgi:hypothetical protein
MLTERGKILARFVKKLGLFALLSVVLLFTLFWLSGHPPFREWFAKLTGSADYKAGEGEAEQYIRKVAADASGDVPCRVLILGDSVCNQMFHSLQDCNPSFCIDGNNRGMTLAGEYLLLDEFLRHHNEVTDVYLFIGTDMLRSDIDTIYGYQYVVIPFARYDMLERLAPETIETLTELYGSLFLNKTVACMIGNSSVGRKLYLNYLKEKNEVAEVGAIEQQWLSETARIYLPRIHALCRERQITLHLLATPQADNPVNTEQVAAMRDYLETSEYAEYFAEYFQTLAFYPEEQFADGIHFGGAYNTQAYFNRLIEELYQEQGYLDTLILAE